MLSLGQMTVLDVLLKLRQIQSSNRAASVDHTGPKELSKVFDWALFIAAAASATHYDCTLIDNSASVPYDIKLLFH